MFQKKSKNIQESILAVDSRILELQKRKTAKEKDVEECKDNVGQILGLLALSENSENVERLKTGKKALERTEEVYSDICQQLDFLTKEKVKLDRELLEAQLRDLPLKAEEAAQSFNKILDECLPAMEVLRDLHTKLKEAETAFITLGQQHQNACTKLNIVKGLELRQGLGLLAFIGGPYSMNFSVPDFHSFIGNLEAYKLKVADYENFKKSNPNYEKDIAETREHDRKSGEMEFGKSFDKVFSLPGSQ